MAPLRTGTLRQLALLLTTAIPIVFGQTSILPSSGTSTFPACAVNCAILQSAAGSCQATPSRLQADINSCFCQSALLPKLKSSPGDVCGSSCTSQSDLNELQTWYNNFCGSGGGGGGVVTTTQTAPAAGGTGTTLTRTTTSPTQTTSPTSTIVSGSAGQTNGVGPNQGWFHNHWRWIIMAAIVVVGFIVVVVVAVWLKRRHRRKQEALKAPAPAPAPSSAPMSQLSLGSPAPGTRTGTMQSTRTRTGTMQSRRGDMREVWGPHQHMAATRGWEYTPSGVVERDGIERVGSPSRTATLSSTAGGMDRRGRQRDYPIDENVLADAIATRMEEDGKDNSKKTRRNPSVKIDEQGAATAAAAANASLQRHQSRTSPGDRDGSRR